MPPPLSSAGLSVVQISHPGLVGSSDPVYATVLATGAQGSREHGRDAHRASHAGGLRNSL